MKWWSIYHFRFSLSPLPKRAKHSSGAPVKRAGTGDAPKFILAAHAHSRRLLDRALTRLPKPIEALMMIQLCLQLLGKRQKIMHVVERIFRHASRQRPLRPIGFL